VGENNKIYGSLSLWIGRLKSSKKNPCELHTHKDLNKDEESYLII
jgi:hypothetical protein